MMVMGQQLAQSKFIHKQLQVFMGLNATALFTDWGS
jgi:hypothetical protein